MGRAGIEPTTLGLRGPPPGADPRVYGRAGTAEWPLARVRGARPQPIPLPTAGDPRDAALVHRGCIRVLRRRFGRCKGRVASRGIPSGGIRRLTSRRPLILWRKAMPRPPGQIRDAILDALQDKPDGTKVGEIRRDVERIVGGAVAPSSVRSYLQLGTDASPPLFERTALGTYRIARRRR